MVFVVGGDGFFGGMVGKLEHELPAVVNGGVDAVDAADVGTGDDGVGVLGVALEVLQYVVVDVGIADCVEECVACIIDVARDFLNGKSCVACFYQHF